jgi:hypothetical protein
MGRKTNKMRVFSAAPPMPAGLIKERSKLFHKSSDQWDRTLAEFVALLAKKDPEEDRVVAVTHDISSAAINAMTDAAMHSQQNGNAPLWPLAHDCLASTFGRFVQPRNPYTKNTSQFRGAHWFSLHGGGLPQPDTHPFEVIPCFGEIAIPHLVENMRGKGHIFESSSGRTELPDGTYELATEILNHGDYFDIAKITHAVRLAIRLRPGDGDKWSPQIVSITHPLYKYIQGDPTLNLE